MCGAAAGTLLWADGLQHPALALLQHVFLGMEAGQLAWLTVMEMDTTYSLYSVLSSVPSALCNLRAEKAPASPWALETAHRVITTHFQALL